MLRTSLMAGVLALAPLAAMAETITATVVAGHPPVFRWVRVLPEVFEPAVNAALEGSGYDVAFDNQFGGAIAKVGEELETVGEGLAEIGTIQALFDPAKLAIQNVTYYTPFVTADPRAIQELMGKLHLEAEGMQQAYDDENIVYLGAPTVIDDYLLMTNFPVNSMADLEGRRIAAPGAAVNWLSGTGAVGVSGNLTTYYNEIQTGVYDGVLVFASAALPGKLYEVAPYITKLGLGAQFAGVIGANKDWYDGLPEEVQQALRTGADAAADWYMADLEAFVDVAFTKMAEAGATITEASPTMRAEWATNMDNVARTWAAQLDGQGLPATAMLKTYMDGMRAAGATPLRDWDKE
ncbi:C4-dicarboxylate TRAP transporter substrate-binding protein [Chachezhania sediminis]|uniref:C4-dicarboxylate TRAP transporter substrate-binding protein n=1 Tax=Chachezhania sediminis TaxID=2599291 RepID=UPI001E515609|nr:C4-dicarboxylate TRAP transporter substrate-binding protein [Chachezhania sediminis]